MADGRVKASLEFDVNQAVRATNQLTTNIAKMEATTVGGAKALSSIEKQSVGAATATQRLATAYKNLATQLARVNKENARLAGSQGLRTTANGARQDIATGRFVSPTNTVALKNAQNAAYRTYTSNIAVAQANRENARLIERQNNGLAN